MGDPKDKFSSGVLNNALGQPNRFRGASMEHLAIFRAQLYQVPLFPSRPFCLAHGLEDKTNLKRNIPLMEMGRRCDGKQHEQRGKCDEIRSHVAPQIAELARRTVVHHCVLCFMKKCVSF